MALSLQLLLLLLLHAPRSAPSTAEVEATRGRHHFRVGGGRASLGNNHTASFATVTAATAAVRALAPAQRCGATVTIAGGVYTGEANALRLTGADSGCVGDPVVYRADPDAPEPVVLSGGTQLDPGDFKPSGQTKAGHPLWEVELASLGLAALAASSGNFHPGWRCANGNRTEFFFGGHAMTLARHPNKEASSSGTQVWQYLRQGEALNATSFAAGTDDTAGGKAIAADEPWLKELDSDTWVHGFWSYDWADSFVPVNAVSSSYNGTVSTVQVDLAAAPHYGLRAGSRYLFLNSKSLLDTPGEYFIERATSKLFFIAPVGADPSKPPISAEAGAFLSHRQYAHTINGTSHVTISGLRLEHGVGSALWVDGVTGVTINNCTLANSGTHGVELTRSSASTISGSDVFDTGCDGVAVNSGDAVKLISANVTVHSCTIHDFARVSRTIRPGVAWGGCGITVSSNEIYNGPHAGIMIARQTADDPSPSDGVGALCVFEDNNLHDLCQGTTDAGGFYAGRTWANRGNIVRRNTFRRIYQTEKMSPCLATSVIGIYLDDQESGFLLEHNHFASMGVGILLGGGRQNIIRANTFVNVSTPLHVDGRGLGDSCDTTGDPTKNPNVFIDELEQGYHFRQPPWSLAFPEINVSVAPCAPALNTVVDNRFCPPKKSTPHERDCATCPSTHKYPRDPSPIPGPQGSLYGAFCCSVPLVGGRCQGPKASVCCLTPGVYCLQISPSFRTPGVCCLTPLLCGLFPQVARRRRDLARTGARVSRPVGTIRKISHLANFRQQACQGWLLALLTSTASRSSQNGQTSSETIQSGVKLVLDLGLDIVVEKQCN
jgi:parallel beta-helix repeat protein